MIDDLIRIYLNEELWHKTKLSKEAARRYFETIIKKGRIISYTDKGSVVGYCESWRINYEQFGRIICCESFYPMEEDIENGNIAYLANTFIYPDYRQGKVYVTLRNRFMEQNKECDYFVGEARRKKVGLIKVFKREEIFKKGGLNWEKNAR